MERVKNGTYKTFHGSKEVEITDAIQPVYIKQRRKELYHLKAVAAVTTLSDEQIIIPVKNITETPYKKSWQSRRAERVIPCNIIEELGRVNIPKNANYNLDVKSYCKNACVTGCPALLLDYNKDTYSCQYKRIKDDEYNSIHTWSENNKS